MCLLPPLVPGKHASAQRRMWLEPNAPYDGRFTFARIRYTVYRRSGWEFDYPTMERNLMLMMREVTALRPHVLESNIHTFDDPELMKYPIAYLSEPGYWIPSDAEVEGLRKYLAKGGFLIVDDFLQGEWYNFEEQIRRVLPRARIDRLDLSHTVFDSFFSITTLNMDYPHDSWTQGSVPRDSRGQQPEKAADGGDQLQQRHRRLHGAFGPGLVAGEYEQRGVQVRDQLHHLRAYSLTRNSGESGLEESGFRKREQGSGISETTHPSALNPNSHDLYPELSKPDTTQFSRS